MNNKKLFLLIFLIVTPIIIFLYFLRWRTNTIYGDDLYIYKDHAALKGFFNKISLPTFSGKYRPLHGLSLHLLIETFQKNLNGYYFFNISIQVINTFIFALILHLFLRSSFFSLLFSLIIGLSRFSYFNITQLLNGGALEGLAMTFFLASLYFIIKALSKKELSSSQRQKAVLWSILFANLSMYTHERYLVFFPFLIFVLLIFPDLKTIPLKRRINLSLIVLASVILNIVVKKYFYSMPFFMGTGGTNVDFSFSSALSFFKDAILSIFQFNTGPEYLVGTSFSSLNGFNKALVILLSGIILTILILFFLRRKALILNVKNTNSKYSIFIFLVILFALFLMPAIVTIRLEQRWLQASFSIFILLLVIALSSLQFKKNYLRNFIFFSVILLFLLTDFNYFYKGGDKLYMKYSERLASKFKQASYNGSIHPNTEKLYIWEKHRDNNDEQSIKWGLGDGFFFAFYQVTSKKIIFVDSIYDKSYSFPFSSFPDFDKNTDQIIYISSNVIDITGDYLQDSLKKFTTKKIYRLDSVQQIQYDPRHLLITNEDFDKFSVDGFYYNEKGIRWTNGNASIGFISDYTITDSIRIELNTYMPSVCKNVTPMISIIDDNNKNYPPIFSRREGNKFIFQFYFNQPITIQKINILSETIAAAPPDTRVLSFPFISLEIKKLK